MYRSLFADLNFFVLSLSGFVRIGKKEQKVGAKEVSFGPRVLKTDWTASRTLSSHGDSPRPESEEVII